MLVLLVVLVFLLVFFCLMPFFRAMSKRWKHWEDPENDPRWGAEHFQFSTSPKLAREPVYNRLSNGTLDDVNNLDTSSRNIAGSRLGSRMGSRVGSRVGINREGSYRNISGLPRLLKVFCELIVTFNCFIRDPDQVEIKIPPLFADFISQGIDSVKHICN